MGVSCNQHFSIGVESMETQQSQYGNNKDMKTPNTSGTTSANSHLMSGQMSGQMSASEPSASNSSSTALLNGSITDKIRSGVEQVQSTLKGNVELNKQFNQVKSKAQEAYHVGINFVKANPLSAILGAAAVGFVAAAVFRSGTTEE
jgi:ElaB/YqjD/DUF883 family membrane-anchored ribosome-binding protein